MTEEAVEQESKYPSAERIREDLHFTEATLDDNLIAQAGLYAYYAKLAGDAQFDMDQTKIRLEIIEAQAALRIRDRAENNGTRITEKMIENQVLTEKDVVKARLKFARARRDYEGMRGVVEAMRHKKDAMIQIGVARRTEGEIAARVMERRASASEKAQDTKSAARDLVNRKKAAQG